MSKLPPSERWRNIASAFMTLWPAWIFVFGLLGYTNKDRIEGFMFTNNSDEAIVKLSPFEQFIREEIERIDLEEATGKAELMAMVGAIQTELAQKRQTNYVVLVNRLDELDKKLIPVFGLVD